MNLTIKNNPFSSRIRKQDLEELGFDFRGEIAGVERYDLIIDLAARTYLSIERYGNGNNLRLDYIVNGVKVRKSITSDFSDLAHFIECCKAVGIEFELK